MTQYFYSRKSSKWLDFFLLLLVAIVWGTSYGVAKGAVLYYPVLGFLALRFCLTSIVFLPSIVKLSTKNIFNNIKVGVPLGIILLFIFISETYGLSKTTASNSAFLISLYVIFTPFLQWLILKDRPKKNIIIATVLSIIGAFLLSEKDHEFSLNIGDYLIIFAAMMRGVMVTLTRKLTQNIHTNMVFLTSIQTGIVGLGCLFIGFFVCFNQLITIPTHVTFWISLIYLIIFCTMFAFYVQNSSVKRISPTKVSLLMGSEPVWGALYATIIMNEELSLTNWLGGGMIVIASLLAIINE